MSPPFLARHTIRWPMVSRHTHTLSLSFFLTHPTHRPDAAFSNTCPWPRPSQPANQPASLPASQPRACLPVPHYPDRNKQRRSGHGSTRASNENASLKRPNKAGIHAYGVRSMTKHRIWTSFFTSLPRSVAGQAEGGLPAPAKSRGRDTGRPWPPVQQPY